MQFIKLLWLSIREEKSLLETKKKKKKKTPGYIFTNSEKVK